MAFHKIMMLCAAFGWWKSSCLNNYRNAHYTFIWMFPKLWGLFYVYIEVC